MNSHQLQIRVRSNQRQVGMKVTMFRLHHNISFLELADTSGISKGNLSKIENGKGNPTVETLTKLAYALGVTISELT